MLNDVLDTTPAQSDATAAATQAETVSGSTDTEAPAPIADVDYSVEQVEDKLREKWGSDYDQKYQDTSEAVAHFLKMTMKVCSGLAAESENHLMAVKLALRLAAIYSGNGMPAPPTLPAMNKSLDDALADFQPGAKNMTDGSAATRN
jgi:hypothetical protein